MEVIKAGTELILAKYGEMALKGLNKKTFEDILLRNTKRVLERFSPSYPQSGDSGDGKRARKPVSVFNFWQMQSTLYIIPKDNADVRINEVTAAVSKIFGISAIQRVLATEKTYDSLVANAGYLAPALANAATFKVEAKRADKKFPMNSPQLQREYGGAVLERFPHLKVDVHNPDVTVLAEIRDTNAFISAVRLKGAGGLPVGSSGRVLLMLSGGIDSPVAGYMLAKRGAEVECVHFQSPPYTSERALSKVKRLSELLVPYTGRIVLHIVNFTAIQEAIRDSVAEEYFTLVMRRKMMEIACVIAARRNCGAVVTGESLGQVASQTLSAMMCTDKAADVPVLRPVIGMDKTEIIEIANRIDTFETSTLPYEDCCTVFTPKHPRTNPSFESVTAQESLFDFAPLVAEAIETAERIVIR